MHKWIYSSYLQMGQTDTWINGCTLAVLLNSSHIPTSAVVGHEKWMWLSELFRQKESKAKILVYLHPNLSMLKKKKPPHTEICHRLAINKLRMCGIPTLRILFKFLYHFKLAIYAKDIPLVSFYINVTNLNKLSHL